MGQRSNCAAVKDVRTMPRKEEFALGMGQNLNSHDHHLLQQFHSVPNKIKTVTLTLPHLNRQSISMLP